MQGISDPVVASAAWRIPDAYVADVVAIDAMDAGNRRRFIESATVVLRDIEGFTFVFRRPWNDAAGVVTRWAINANA